MLSWGRQGAGSSVALLYHSATTAVRRWSRPVRLPIHDRCGKSGSSQIAQQRACPACRYRPLGSTQKNVITMIKRDLMLMFLARLPECMTWIYVRAVLHRVRSRKSRILLKYIISDDFHLHLRKLMLRPPGYHGAAVLSMARWPEPLLHAHGTQTNEPSAGGTRRPLHAAQHRRGRAAAL